MKAILLSGAYDGIVLDHNDINLYTQFVPVGIRKFVLMPARKDWDAVRRGDLDKNGPFDGDCPIYELIQTQNGMEGQHDADGSIFAAATKEHSEGRQPVPQVEFTGQYFKCYRGDHRDVSFSDDHFTVTDEKDREWVCVTVSREEGESGGFAEMLSYMGGEPLSKPLRMVIVNCEDKTQLPIRLADVID